LDWRTLNGRANRVAQGLIAAGCARGERVGVVMDNGPAMMEIIVGAMKAGAIVAPLNTTISDGAINAMLKDAEISVLAVSPAHAHRIGADIRKTVPTALVDGASDAGSGWLDYTPWRDSFTAEEPPPVSRETLCNIIYSSGTTGDPKGIVHSHGARLDWTHDLANALRYHCGARLLVTTGLYSNISWVGLLPTYLLGGTAFVRAGFDALDVLQTIARERITHFSMVPVQFQRLIEHPAFGAHDLTSLQAIMCCGAPLPLPLKERLYEAFRCDVIELYGSTEGIITTLAPEDASARLASVGRPIPGEEIAVIDGDNRFLARGQAGEVVAHSRFAMAGYWKKPEATAEAFLIDRNGQNWLRSGDIGVIDAEGFLFVTDRKKDMIISGGQNVYPADLEAVLRRHPSVEDCAVFGIPSERWGETPLALVVLRKDASVDATQLCDWANARLGKQQRLSSVELREALVRNANGKLLKRELRAPYWTKP